MKRHLLLMLTGLTLSSFAQIPIERPRVLTKNSREIIRPREIPHKIGNGGDAVVCFNIPAQEAITENGEIKASARDRITSALPTEVYHAMRRLKDDRASLYQQVEELSYQGTLDVLFKHFKGNPQFFLLLKDVQEYLGSSFDGLPEPNGVRDVKDGNQTLFLDDHCAYLQTVVRIGTDFFFNSTITAHFSPSSRAIMDLHEWIYFLVTDGLKTYSLSSEYPNHYQENSTGVLLFLSKVLSHQYSEEELQQELEKNHLPVGATQADIFSTLNANIMQNELLVQMLYTLIADLEQKKNSNDNSPWVSMGEYDRMFKSFFKMIGLKRLFGIKIANKDLGYGNDRLKVKSKASKQPFNFLVGMDPLFAEFKPLNSEELCTKYDYINLWDEIKPASIQSPGYEPVFEVNDYIKEIKENKLPKYKERITEIQEFIDYYQSL